MKKKSEDWYYPVRKGDKFIKTIIKEVKQNERLEDL